MHPHSRIAVVALLLDGGAHAQDTAGEWHAYVRNPAGGEVAFRLHLSRVGSKWRGDLLNGEDRIPSTAGYFEGGRLLLSFRDWDDVLEARLENGALARQLSAAVPEADSYARVLRLTGAVRARGEAIRGCLRRVLFEASVATNGGGPAN